MGADIADTLRSAKAIIKRDGWKQGYFGPGCCMTQAIWRVPAGARSLAMGFLSEAIGAKHLKGYGIVGWNDAAGRTVEEVYAAFDTAIAAAEAQGQQ